MPNCRHCGAVVSAAFARVFGDNRDAVEGCPQCDAAVRNGRGAPDRER